MASVENDTDDDDEGRGDYNENNVSKNLEN